jgi:2'-5' RNA ligase
MPRLFLGIELSGPLKDAIAEALAPLKTSPKGWEDPFDYHVTLLFLGETPLEEIPLISHELRQISFAPFTLTFRSLVFFNRRVLYLSCDPSPELMQLKSQIDSHFPKYLKPESKKFIPHVTVKRWQRYEFQELKKRIEENPFEARSQRVDHLALFKSEKDSDNHKYHVLERN